MSTTDWRDRIVCEPELHHGEPCIKGTRIPVAILVASLADMSQDDLLKAYPQLSTDDIRAALHFAAEASHRSLVA